MSHDICRLQFHTVGEQAGPRLNAKIDDGSPGHGGRVRNTWQVVGKPLHPQAMQLDPDEFASKWPRPMTVISALVPRIDAA